MTGSSPHQRNCCRTAPLLDVGAQSQATDSEQNCHQQPQYSASQCATLPSPNEMVSVWLDAKTSTTAVVSVVKKSWITPRLTLLLSDIDRELEQRHASTMIRMGKYKMMGSRGSGAKAAQWQLADFDLSSLASAKIPSMRSTNCSQHHETICSPGTTCAAQSFKCFYSFVTRGAWSHLSENWRPKKVFVSLKKANFSIFTGHSLSYS